MGQSIGRRSLNADIVLAATNSGIYRTVNGGTTWTEVYSYPTISRWPGRVQDLRPQPGNINRIIAGINGHDILLSNDTGVTWRDTDAYSGEFERIELAYSESQPDTAYAAVDAGPSSAPTSVLLVSYDGGETWTVTNERGSSNTNWLGSQGWYNNTLAVHPFNPNTVFLGGIVLWRARITNTGNEYPAPIELDRGGTDSWMSLTNFGASHFGGVVDYMPSGAVDVTESYYATIEFRFGQGSQKAHRFTVAENSGTYGNGGSGVPYSEYEYADDVDVPFQVWDTDNSQQLMLPFRDQADDGEFNLLEYYTSTAPNTRDSQSRECMIINRYNYDDTDAHTDIAADGGLVNGMMYFIWPTLESGATWDAATLPNQTMTIKFGVETSITRSIDQPNFASRPHVDHHNITPLPVAGSSSEFWVLNANDGGVALSTDGGATFSEKDDADAAFNTSSFMGYQKNLTPLFTSGESRIMEPGFRMTTPTEIRHG